jgi:site-specific DNA-methyltransferase (cytosine-N4-specific)
MLTKADSPTIPDVARITRPAPLLLRGATIFAGDALTVLRRLPSESVRCIVTSPPYWGLRDYGYDEQIGLEATLSQFLHRLVAVFAESKRVLTDDGTLWLNIGDSYTSGNRGLILFLDRAPWASLARRRTDNMSESNSILIMWHWLRYVCRDRTVM